MDKKTEKRYKKIKRDQKKLKEQIKKSEDELELLRLEEEEIAGQEIMAICYEQKINLLDAVKIFTKTEKTSPGSCFFIDRLGSIQQYFLFHPYYFQSKELKL